MRISYLLLGLLLPAASADAQALGVWHSGFGQGTSEYSVQNDSAASDRFSIGCSPDFGTWLDLSVAGKSPPRGSAVTIDVGAEEFTFQADGRGAIHTASHVDSDNFAALWNAIRRGSVMRVRLSSGQTTTFKLAGAARALPPSHCTTDFER